MAGAGEYDSTQSNILMSDIRSSRSIRTIELLAAIIHIDFLRIHRCLLMLPT